MCIFRTIDIQRPAGETKGYEKKRGSPSGSGELEAAFDGKHGWFGRNRTGTMS
jgi:hypothetical protein